MKYISNFNLKCKVITYNPASNGMEEYQNKKIIENMRSMVGDMSHMWHEWTPQVAASLNLPLNSSIGDTPTT